MTKIINGEIEKDLINTTIILITITILENLQIFFLIDIAKIDNIINAITPCSTKANNNNLKDISSNFIPPRYSYQTLGIIPGINSYLF